MKKYFLVAVLLLITSTGVAIADNRFKPNTSIQELTEVSGSSLAATDFFIGFDTSANDFIKSDPTDANILSGTIDGATIGGSTAGAGNFTTLDATGATTLIDTTVTGDLDVLTGDFSVGNGVPDVTLDGEDAYIEGTLEVDGAARFDGTVTFGNTWTFASTAVASAPIINPGRDYFTICGEATTVNNNTVFYGPNVTTLLPNAGNGQTCDINAVGNVTEATADAPAYTGLAFQVLGFTCRNEADANADISFTLRTAAGATVPSVTCTISDGDRDCVADVQTTTAIASAATVAIAAASSGDIADANGFVCTVAIAY